LIVAAVKYTVCADFDQPVLLYSEKKYSKKMLYVDTRCMKSSIYFAVF